MTTRRIIAWGMCVLALAALVTPGATAGKPTIERFDVDETFPDDFLTEACRVDVTTHAKGHVILRTFSGGGTGPVELQTLNIRLTERRTGTPTCSGMWART